jgi:hypothetical protein
MKTTEQVWKFETARFRVTLEVEPDNYHDEDEDYEPGNDVIFNSAVTVYLNDRVIGSDSLCGSIYDQDHVRDFWTAHRDSNPLNRNCTIMRKIHGDIIICHYFPSMVREAIKEARQFLALAKKAETNENT